jgi:predicted HAD superfamily phosphohydrolase YqeG|tara:strand:- start:1910 stop:2269 length:360 start_codon:yes stop_codon:yes gene_type:complete
MIGPAGPNDAVMFDIDDTLIWTSGQANAPIIQLLHRMKALGYRIVIITARPGVEIGVKLTIKQLKDHGIVYDYLGFTSAQTKTIMKKKLGYNFVLSVGDMPTDWTDSKYYINTSSSYHN